MKSRERACCSPSINTFILSFLTPNMPKQNMNTTKLYLRLDTMGFCRWHSLFVQVLRGCSLHKLTWKCCPWGFLQEALIVRGPHDRGLEKHLLPITHHVSEVQHFTFPLQVPHGVALGFCLVQDQGRLFLVSLSFWSFGEVAALASSSKE